MEHTVHEHLVSPLWLFVFHACKDNQIFFLVKRNKKKCIVYLLNENVFLLLGDLINQKTQQRFLIPSITMPKLYTSTKIRIYYKSKWTFKYFHIYVNSPSNADTVESFFKEFEGRNCSKHYFKHYFRQCLLSTILEKRWFDSDIMMLDTHCSACGIGKCVPLTWVLIIHFLTFPTLK